jgi:hypothetical protein
MNKIYDEKKFWGRCNQTSLRTLRINAFGRTEHIKNWLFKSILMPNSGISVDEAIKEMTDFEWLKHKQILILS